MDVPRTLPVENLSASSIRTFLTCPEKWRRRYIERQYEATSPAMLLGSAAGAAEAQAYHAQIAGERPPTEAVLDIFADEFSERSEREEVEWGAQEPGAVKDQGVLALTAYEEVIVPQAQPVAVEREIRVQPAHVDWGVLAYLDREDADGRVKDMKVKARKLGAAEAHADLQAGIYLLGRRAEGNPAPGFDFECVIKNKKPYAEVVPTERTDAQLDLLTDRVYAVAAEISWRLESETWAYAAPGSWLCSSCGYRDCPMHP